MQAIEVRYLPPTDYLPARLKAFCQAGAVIVSFDDGLDDYERDLAAARALCRKLKWYDIDLVAYGHLKNGDAVFCTKYRRYGKESTK